MLVAEFVPAAPAIPALTVLAGCLVALGLLYASKYLFSFLAWFVKNTVGKVPLVGRLFASGVGRAEQALDTALTPIITGVEARIAHEWHSLGSIIRHTGYTIAHLAGATAHLAWYVTRKWSVEALALRAAKALLHTHFVQRVLNSFTHRLGHLYTIVRHPEAGEIGGTLRHLLKPYAARLARLERWTHQHVNALAALIEAELPLGLPLAGLISLPLRKWLAKLEKLLRRNSKALGISSATAIVAIALARLGGGWIRCTNWRRVGKQVCGMPGHFLDDLLGLVADFAVLTSICQVLPWLEEGASVVAIPLIEALSVAGAGLCGGPGDRAADLPGVTLYLPAYAGPPTLHLP